MGDTNNFRLIAAMPRSGSTLLLRQFNSCSDTLLMGESSRALIDLLNFSTRATNPEFYDNCRGNWDDLEAQEKFPAWYNTFDEDAMRGQIVNLIQTWLNPLGNNFWGCKQILFGASEDPLFLFDNLVSLLPGAKVTVLTRDIKLVEKSCKKKFNNIPRYVYKQRDRLIGCKGKRPYISHLEYDDLTDQSKMESYFSSQGIQTDSDKLAAVIAKRIR